MAAGSNAGPVYDASKVFLVRDGVSVEETFITDFQATDNSDVTPNQAPNGTVGQTSTGSSQRITFTRHIPQSKTQRTVLNYLELKQSQTRFVVEVYVGRLENDVFIPGRVTTYGGGGEEPSAQVAKAAGLSHGSDGTLTQAVEISAAGIVTETEVE